MTSNIGANLIKNSAGLGFKTVDADQSYEKMKEMVLTEVERHFRPEFLNRIDELVVFNSLERTDMESIVKIELRKVSERLIHKQLELDVEQGVLDYMIDKSFHEDFGARPLKRAIERYIEDPLSEEILRGNLETPHFVYAFMGEDEVQFRFEEKPMPEEEGDSSGTEAVGSGDSEGSQPNNG